MLAAAAWGGGGEGASGRWEVRELEFTGKVLRKPGPHRNRYPQDAPGRASGAHGFSIRSPCSSPSVSPKWGTPVCVCMYVCTCVHVCMHGCMGVFVCARVCVCGHVCIHVCTCECACMHMCVCALVRFFEGTQEKLGGREREQKKAGEEESRPRCHRR